MNTSPHIATANEPRVRQAPVRIVGSTPNLLPGESGADFVGRFAEVVGWLDRAGWSGALIGTSNLLLDPWLLAQIMIERTRSLRPLVATQPIYEHPFAVANKASTLAALYNRGVDFNFVAGDHPRDRESLNDTMQHDARYARLSEYAVIIRQLLDSPQPVNFSGQYYSVKHLLPPRRPAIEVRSDFYMSGTSAAARATVVRLDACAIEYPEKPGDPSEIHRRPPDKRGIRVGIIARRLSGEAWDVAHAKFPPDAEGEAIRKYAARASDSEWVKTLLEASAHETQGAYWLSPFRRFQRACPYLVGSYEEVRAVLKQYIDAGYRTVLVDAIASEAEACIVKDLIETATGH